MKKLNFEYAVSSITGFTDQMSTELITKSLVGAQTPKYGNVRLGIKGTQTVNLLDSTIYPQSGDCGWSASGTTTLSQIDLTVCPEKINEALCPKDLYSTYQSKMLQAGQTEEEVPFQNMIADLKVAQIQKRIESKLWGATTAGGDCFNGLKTLIPATTGTTGVADANGTAFDVTKSYGTDGNPIYEIDKMVNALSDDALTRDDLIVWMSYSNFRKYLQSLTQGNYFANYIDGANVTQNMEATHPNTNIKVVPTHGLNGSNRVVLGPAEFLVIGFDLLSDHEGMDMWYSRDNDEIRLRANYNYGVNIVKFSDIDYWVTNNVE